MVQLDATRFVGDAAAKAALHAEMAELIRRIAEGRDREAFRGLYAQYGPRIRALLMRQGADADTAEELAQETLLTVWRKAYLFSAHKGSATTWIFTIARNLRIDRLRREVPWQELDDETSEYPADDKLPDDQVAERQDRQRVREALSQLPTEQYDVVALSYLEGLSHSEIAERLNLPLGTVKSRMRLAYRKIKETIGED